VASVFSQQDGIYGFKFLKRFLEISEDEGIQGAGSHIIT
jgi:hypothetical protein